MEYYNAISEGYDELYGNEQINKLKTIKENIVLKKEPKILDIGCGSGLATTIFEGKYIGVEPAKKLASNPRLKNHKIIISNYEDVKIAEKFDLILCISTIHHFKDLNKGLENIISNSYENTIIAITILKNIKRKNEIKEAIFKKLKLVKEIKEQKDDILILKIKG